jgi:hypothetical protein
MERWLGLGVIASNLRRMALAKAAEGSEETKSHQ